MIREDACNFLSWCTTHLTVQMCFSSWEMRMEHVNFLWWARKDSMRWQRLQCLLSLCPGRQSSQMNGEAQNLGKGEDSRIWRTVLGFVATHHPCFIIFLLLLELPLWDEPCPAGVVPCFSGTLKLPNKTKLSPLMPFASCVFLCFAGLKAENPATRLHSSADLGPGMGKACHNSGHVSTCKRFLMIDDARGWPSSKALLSRIFSLDSGRFLLTAKGCPSSFFFFQGRVAWPDASRSIGCWILWSWISMDFRMTSESALASRISMEYQQLILPIWSNMGVSKTQSTQQELQFTSAWFGMVWPFHFCDWPIFSFCSKAIQILRSLLPSISSCPWRSSELLRVARHGGAIAGPLVASDLQSFFIVPFRM